MFVILATDKFLQRIGAGYPADRSHFRPALREESTPQIFGNPLSADWIPPAGRDGNGWRFVRDAIPNDTTTPRGVSIDWGGRIDA
jgi:hypothetical protein